VWDSLLLEQLPKQRGRGPMTAAASKAQLEQVLINTNVFGKR
jgi:hypothetical protein